MVWWEILGILKFYNGSVCGLLVQVGQCECVKLECVW